MALARARRNEAGFNYWPGFVDALSTLVLSIVFLLSVFLVRAVLPVSGSHRQGQGAGAAQRQDRPAHRPVVAGKDRQALLDDQLVAVARRRSPPPKPSATASRAFMKGLPRPAAMPPAAAPNSTARWIPKSRYHRARWRRSRCSISRSAPCAGSWRRWKKRSTPRRSATRNRSGRSPISASGSTSRWRSGCRNCRATARNSSASCAQSSATGPTSASSATASCSNRKCSSTPAAALLLPEGRAELDKVAGALVDLEKQIPAEIAWVLRVDGHTDVRPMSAARSSSRTGNCRRRARSRWCNI